MQLNVGDAASSLVIWGRMPANGLTGKELANVIDAVATEADFIREELQFEEE